LSTSLINWPGYVIERIADAYGRDATGKTLMPRRLTDAQGSDTTGDDCSNTAGQI